MKNILEILGGLLLIQGAGGLAHELFGWMEWGFIQKLSMFDGYELYASIAVLALAVAAFAAAQSAKS